MSTVQSWAETKQFFVKFYHDTKTSHAFEKKSNKIKYYVKNIEKNVWCFREFNGNSSSFSILFCYVFDTLTLSSHSKSKSFLNPDDIFVGKAN